MGPYPKTVILLLLLVYLDPFIGRVKGLEHGVNSPNEDMIEVKMRKLVLEVDVQTDYSPGSHANIKHEPPPLSPRAKSGTSAGGGR